MKELFKELFVKVDVMAFLVGSTVMVSFIVMVLSLIFIPIPKDNQDALYLLIGIISGGVGSLVGYYFGSSKGSQKKSDLIEKITEQK